MARVARAAQTAHDRSAERLNGWVARLESVSPARVLERGYAMVTDASGTPVTHVTGVSRGDAVTLRFQDGETGAVIGDGAGTSPGPGSAEPTPKTPKPKKASSKKTKQPDDRQGSLL